MPSNILLPGVANSNLIKIDKQVPITPAKAPKNIYKVPISLWFVDHNHLYTNDFIGIEVYKKIDTNVKINLLKKIIMLKKLNNAGIIIDLETLLQNAKMRKKPK